MSSICVAPDEMSESRQTHVTLHDIDPQALEQLVQYAYTAEIVVGEGNVQVGASPQISLLHKAVLSETCRPETFLSCCCSVMAPLSSSGQGIRLLPCARSCGSCGLCGWGWLLKALRDGQV